MIKLHYFPSTASMAPHIVLQELGIEFELVKVDKDGGELASEAYRRLNPNGLIPVLQDNDLVMYESAAICMHLVGGHPQAGLLPSLGTAQRAHCYKWMFWLSGTLQPALNTYFYPDRWATDDSAIAQVKDHAQKKAGSLYKQLDDQLASTPGGWVLGDQFTVVDVYALMLCRWSRNFSGTKARDFAHIGPWLARVIQRPAVVAVFEREALALPWV